MPDRVSIDKAIAALEAVYLIRETFASSDQAVRRIQDVAEMLDMRDVGGGEFGGICHNVAEAILKAYGGDVTRLASYAQPGDT